MVCYSGDADGRVPVIGTRYCIEALGLPLKIPWTSWFHKHQVSQIPSVDTPLEFTKMDFKAY